MIFNLSGEVSGTKNNQTNADESPVWLKTKQGDF